MRYIPRHIARPHIFQQAPRLQCRKFRLFHWRSLWVIFYFSKVSHFADKNVISSSDAVVNLGKAEWRIDTGQTIKPAESNFQEQQPAAPSFTALERRFQSVTIPSNLPSRLSAGSNRATKSITGTGSQIRHWSPVCLPFHPPSSLDITIDLDGQSDPLCASCSGV